MYLGETIASISNTTIVENSGENGEAGAGGVFVGSFGNATLANCIVRNNVALLRGPQLGVGNGIMNAG